MTMKPSLAILILIVAALFACNGDDVRLPITPNLVPTVKAYDLDNNGNSSDIRVDFVVQDNLNVIEYRIMVIPSSFSNSFDEGIAASISVTSYLSVLPESFKVEHSFQRLPSGLSDVNGSQIQNEKEYVVAVFVVGVGNHQLKAFSTPFTLKDQGIYTGKYFYGTEHTCSDEFGGSFSGTNPADGLFFVDFTENDDFYSGIFQCNECSNSAAYLGTASFYADGMSISNYIREAIKICPGGCGDGECPLIQIGDGIVVDELMLEIEFTSVTCHNSCEGTLFFPRQG